MSNHHCSPFFQIISIIVYIYIKKFKSYNVSYLRPICFQQKEWEFKQRKPYRLTSLKRGAVGGTILLPLVIGPHSACDTSNCPITYEFMGSVCENKQ